MKTSQLTTNMQKAVNAGISFKASEHGQQSVSELSRQLYRAYTDLIAGLTELQQAEVMLEVSNYGKLLPSINTAKQFNKKVFAAYSDNGMIVFACAVDTIAQASEKLNFKFPNNSFAFKLSPIKF